MNKLIYNYTSLEGYSNEYGWIKLSTCKFKAMKTYNYLNYIINFINCSDGQIDQALLTPEEKNVLLNTDNFYKVYYVHNKYKKEKLQKGIWIGYRIAIKEHFKNSINHDWNIENNFKLYIKKVLRTY